MRLWWRPGLPRLTEEGLLLVPDEGPEARRRQIQAIWNDLQANKQEKEKKRAASDVCVGCRLSGVSLVRRA